MHAINKHSMNIRKAFWHARDNALDLARAAGNRLKPIYCPLQQRANNGVFAVDIDARVGLFAQLTWVIYLLQHCDEQGLEPFIRLTGALYGAYPGQDWLPELFDLGFPADLRARVAAGAIRVSNVSDYRQIGLGERIPNTITVDRAATLLSTRMRVQPALLAHVDAFVSRHFAGRQVIGLHFRGTDKSSEARRVSGERCAATIERYRATHPDMNALFVASDEEAFVAWMRERFSDIEVIAHDDLERSRDGRAIHTNSDEGDNALKAREALINTLLLSRCQVLIRSASFLSAWASLFAPELPIIMLNRPYDHALWFPDAELITRSMTEYLPDDGIA